VTACGDNSRVEVDAGCTTAVLLPGPLSDPFEMPLPDPCVPDGMRDVRGRWCFADVEYQNVYAYPRFEVGCDGNVQRTGDVLDDDASDGYTHAWWSDGTRWKPVC
jgi:hypothetical protein